MRLFQLSDWIKYWKELYSRCESVKNSSKVIYLPLLQEFKILSNSSSFTCNKKKCAVPWCDASCLFQIFFSMWWIITIYVIPHQQDVVQQAPLLWRTMGSCDTFGKVQSSGARIATFSFWGRYYGGRKMLSPFCKNWILWWIVLITADWSNS